jgi:hypothetical protein
MHITERANVTRSQIHGRSSEYVTDSRRLIKKKKRDLINGKEPLNYAAGPLLIKNQEEGAL